MAKLSRGNQPKASQSSKSARSSKAAASARVPALEARGSVPGKVDADVVAVFQDSAKKAIPPAGGYAALVERLRKGESFNARHGSVQFVRFGGKGAAENVLLAGLGQAAELTEEKVRVAAAHVWNRLTAEKCRTAAIHVGSLTGGSGGARALSPSLLPVNLVRAFAEGIVLSAYQFVKHKSAKGALGATGTATIGTRGEYRSPERLTFVTPDKTLQAQLATELARVAAMADAVNVTRDWSNEPSNIGTPEFYAGEAKRLAREYGIKCTVLTERDAAREKMGLFLGVGQGSVREGRIVVLEYRPKAVRGKSAPRGNMKTIALVGKGVTFDSGGISIKPSMRMEEMKHDMTGAATIMGATLCAAAWQVPNRVISVLAFTENMPDGDAIQPGNVIRSRAGKTVEIINTDAEGRLILADALDYAQDFKPDAVIDAATLTGAVSVALGKYYCGLFGNDEALIDAIRRAGNRYGEKIWELPVTDEYFEDIKSETADMKNSANDGYGGASRGAVFLKQFIRKGVPWAHLDIAATSSNIAHLPYFPRRGASGSFVRTLAQFVADF
jgi:leucyl aminopeptidase